MRIQTRSSRHPVPPQTPTAQGHLWATDEGVLPETHRSGEAEVEFPGAAECTVEKKQWWDVPAPKHAKQKLREEEWGHDGTRHAEQAPPAFPAAATGAGR